MRRSRSSPGPHPGGQACCGCRSTSPGSSNRKEVHHPAVPLATWHVFTWSTPFAPAGKRRPCRAVCLEGTSARRTHHAVDMAGRRRDGRRVFVVQGRDRAVSRAMKELLRALDLRVVEWEEGVAATG